VTESNASYRAKRAYHSPTRLRQAEETRQRMLAAARRLFAERGYAGTTVEAIAEEAGVSPKTLVAAFGAKRAILGALLDPAELGTPYQESVAQVRAEPDPHRRIALVARLARQIYETWSLELALLRGAGAVAPELAEIARAVEERRWHQQERLVAFLQEHGVLRLDLAPDQATDALWALASFDVYHMLVMERGWPPERYEAWLGAMLRWQLCQQA
jgi:AcrR family transcriptional regulator